MKELKTMEEKKKSNKGLIIIIVVLVILLLGSIGCIGYGYIKYDNEEEKLITDPTKKKDSLNDEIILLTYDKSTRKVSSILKDSSLIKDN